MINLSVFCLLPSVFCLRSSVLLAVHPLAHVNALLNTTATVLLVLGYILIKRRREQAHRRTMLAAFAVSAAFLACYLAYHFGVLGATITEFSGQGAIRITYFVILISHIILAVLIPPIALRTIFLGLLGTGQLQPRALRGLQPGDTRILQYQTVTRQKHVRIARWTLPLWLYVSVTGVIVYLMLYHL